MNSMEGDVEGIWTMVQDILNRVEKCELMDVEVKGMVSNVACKKPDIVTTDFVEDVSEDSETDSDDYDEDDAMDADEIDAMLDEKYNEYSEQKKAKRARHDKDADGAEMAHEERQKVVLKPRGRDHFEVLPEGWIEVTHNSGMPVYLHKSSRVCTLSKPYFLGPGSARKHGIPVTAIPCLHYRREVAKEAAAQASVTQQTSNAMNNASGSRPVVLPNARIETVTQNAVEKSVGFMELREYCQKLFEFKTITVRRFRSWAGRRKHQKRMKQLHRPTLPIGTKLITCPLPISVERDEAVGGASGESGSAAGGGGGGSSSNNNTRRAEFVMNPNGKSYVCILHEYVQHAMRVQPRYVFQELENASTPYGSKVLISDMEYGSGFGSSKKHAKSEAARSTLEILIPQLKDVNPNEKLMTDQNQDLAFFDEVRIEDPRVSELCSKAGQPSPYQILLECLKRNYGMGDTQIKFETRTLKHQKSEFTMVVGKHVVSVVCKNKRDGKQRASQAVLQALHTHISSWGSLLRLYGKGSCKTLKEKKQEEQQITELQCRTTTNKPNQSILSKLRNEMLKLKVKRELLVPITRFNPSDIEPPSTSSSNLGNVDL